MMSELEYAGAVAEFMRKKGVTRCPTAFVVPTHASVGEADRAALRNHEAAREAVRQEKLRSYQQLPAVC
ncbi:MAG TPA: hypothetical protein VMF86_13250 [Stellaceae bacterium]|nr:hypothetical protein [Stellaceae bacterium]